MSKRFHLRTNDGRYLILRSGRVGTITIDQVVLGGREVEEAQLFELVPAAGTVAIDGAQHAQPVYVGVSEGRVLSRSPAGPVVAADHGERSTAHAWSLRKIETDSGGDIAWDDVITLRGDGEIPIALDGDALGSTLGPVTEFTLVRPLDEAPRIQLGASDGRFVVAEASGEIRANRAEARAWELFEVHHETSAAGEVLRIGDRLRLRSAHGRWWRVDDAAGNMVVADQEFRGDAEVFELLAADGATGPADHEQAVALRAVRTGQLLAVRDGGNAVRADAGAPQAATRLTLRLRRDVHLMYHPAQTDHRFVTDPGARRAAEAAGYRYVTTPGAVWLGRVPNGRPLRAWSRTLADGTTDSLLTATLSGEKAALDRLPYWDGATEAGVTFPYSDGGVLGWVKAEPTLDHMPIKQYFSTERRDHLLTGDWFTERSMERRYRFVRVEGYLYRAPDEVDRPAEPDPAPDTATIRPEVLERLGGAAGIRDLARNNRLPGERLREVSFDPARLRPRRRRQRGLKALVLSGGGAKGCFEVGAARRLWEDGWRPDIICGVSVGAVNAVKLAEGDSGPAQLDALWREMASGELRVRDPNWHLDRLMGWIEHHLKGKEGEIMDRFIGSFFAGGLAGLGLGVDDLLDKVGFTALHMHAIHSMEPLRQVIRSRLNPAAILASGIDLRIGLVAARSGRYLNVTGPLSGWTDSLSDCGRLEVEPDHGRGDDWLTRPIYGADSYAVPLADAVYMSSALPVFMEPLLARFNRAVWTDAADERVVRLPFDLPPAVQRLFRTSGPPARWDEDLRAPRGADGQYDHGFLGEESIGARDDTTHLFDGGLRDTVPLRTALRMGARDIVVVTGDRAEASPWSFAPQDSLERVPAFQYLFRLISVWANDVTRNDVMLSVAHNEFLGWMWRAMQKMEPTQRDEFARELGEYFRAKGPALRRTLGAGSWLGGEQGLVPSGSTNPFGAPTQDEAARIRYIAPDRDLLDALAFEAGPRLIDGIELGYERARDPVEVSHPVPESLAVEG